MSSSFVPDGARPSSIPDATTSPARHPGLQADDFRVSRIRALRGPNFWRLAPVIACDVHQGEFENRTTDELLGFNDRLLGFLPSLREHPCSREGAGGFAARLRDGTSLPHVLEHVALELQTLAGNDVAFGRMVRSGDAGVWWVIVAYEEEEVGIEAMHEAARLIRACIADAPFDIDDVVDDLQHLYQDVRLGPSTAAVVDEARRRGIPVRRLDSRSLVRLGLGRHQRRVRATLTDRSSSIAVDIAQDKEETKRVLAEFGLPVPHGRVVRTIDRALEAAAEIGYPVILKPLDASHGRGISTRLDTAAMLDAAWDQTRDLSSRVIVERYHAGRDHRILVVGGRFVACAERLPAQVVGDGERTVAELIERENRDPRRGIGHRKILTRLPSDSRTVEVLAGQGFTLTAVPPRDQVVYLRTTANLSTGGTSVDRTEEIHAENIIACEMAAGAVGLDIAGIDVLTSDIAVPFRANRAVILEVNAAPGIRMHTHPTLGAARNVAAPIIDMLYPPGTEATIPIIAVTGTNGKTTTVRLIAHLFRNTGHRVGFTTTDGVYLQNRCVMEGDMTGPFAANIILSNPGVDVAVLETARGGIVRSGLGFDECDVGVVLNVSADHLGLRGIHTVEQLAELKGVVAAVVRRDGHAVLNADDPLVYGMRSRTAADVVLFSTGDDERHPRLDEHTARGGISARVQQGQFVLRRGRVQIPIATEREVPLLLGGTARFQRQNVLAAIASAFALGVRYDDIRAGLLSFFPSPSMTPGRMNMMRLHSGGRVIVDYAHNAAAIQGLIDFVLSIPAGRRIGVIGMPGDRRDEDIREFGRLCARFDEVILKEDADLRGRRPGEISALLREGLNAGGLGPDAVTAAAGEADAVRRGMARLREGDLLVVLVARVATAIGIVEEQAVPEAR